MRLVGIENSDSHIFKEDKMRTKLQIALDDITLEQAFILLEQVHEDLDIIEVGTPFMMEYGMMAVRELKKRFPSKEILCDGKIMDAGGCEADLAYRAGADYVTVLAVTDDLTIRDVVLTAKKAGKKVMADMICVSDLKNRIPTLETLGVDIISVHTGVDQQAAGRTPLDDLKEIKVCAKCSRLAVAGGINADSINDYLTLEPDIVIIGSGITHAKDPAAAIRTLTERIKKYENYAANRENPVVS